MVANLTLPVVEPVDAARAHGRDGFSAEEPVDDVDLMAGELGQETAGVAFVEAPVEQMLERGVAPLGRVVIRRGRIAFAAPVAVAMPGDAREVDVAQHTRLDDALEGRLIHRVVVALIADLEDTVRRDGGRAHALAARDIPRHHLLAEDMLAGFEAAHGDVGVRPQRHGDDHGLDVLVRDHVAPFGVVLRRGQAPFLEDFIGLGQLRRVDIGHGQDGAELRIHFAEQHAAFAADPDEPDANRAASDRSLDCRRDAEACQRRHTGDRFQEVPPSDCLLFRRQVHRNPPQSRLDNSPPRSSASARRPPSHASARQVGRDQRERLRVSGAIRASQVQPADEERRGQRVGPRRVGRDDRRAHDTRTRSCRARVNHVRVSGALELDILLACPRRAEGHVSKAQPRQSPRASCRRHVHPPAGSALGQCRHGLPPADTNAWRMPWSQRRDATACTAYPLPMAPGFTDTPGRSNCTVRAALEDDPLSPHQRPRRLESLCRRHAGLPTEESPTGTERRRGHVEGAVRGGGQLVAKNKELEQLIADANGPGRTQLVHVRELAGGAKDRQRTLETVSLCQRTGSRGNA